MSDRGAVQQVPVVIVGAGPTGVTAATLLAQYGIRCLLLDRWTNVYPQPRAVHMDDEICRIIARLGIADEFAAISRPAEGLRLLSNTLEVLAEFHRDTARSRHGFPQANMFDQPELEALLRANIKHYPCAAFRGGVEVTEIADDGRGRVAVTFEDRSDATRHVVEANYVLGCDGANSVVRSSIGSALRDMKFDQRWLVVDIATTADLDQWDGVHQVCDPGRAGTYMRIGDTRYRWEFKLLAGESADDFNDLTALLPLIDPWVRHVSLSELTLIRVAEYTFRAKIAEQWRRGNVFLLGDAAHLTPPFIGQGMGAGLRDAMNLAWKLVGVLNGRLPPDALDTYEQERKPHACHMIRIALGVGWSMTAGGRFGNSLRRILVPRLRFVPGLRNKILDSRTPKLHRSMLVARSRAPHRLAGTLCPNPVLDAGERLDAVLGDGFAVITATNPDPVQQARLDDDGIVVHLAEPGSELAEWLRRGHVTAAVIRPDRTVMSAGRNIDVLCRTMPSLQWSSVDA
ncbi:MAG: bifunctional 3-(3-hydroxy-phenyl)propionate/3-hydroxycinnamic acid hydroxylase [Mycobacterium sp.]